MEWNGKRFFRFFKIVLYTKKKMVLLRNFTERSFREPKMVLLGHVAKTLFWKLYISECIIS